MFFCFLFWKMKFLWCNYCQTKNKRWNNRKMADNLGIQRSLVLSPFDPVASYSVWTELLTFHSSDEFMCKVLMWRNMECSEIFLCAVLPLHFSVPCTAPIHRLPSSSMVSSSSVRMACVIKFNSSHMVSQRYATRMSGTLVRLMSFPSCPSMV